MYDFINYSTIEDRNGKPYLYDARKCEILFRQVDELEKAYRDIRDLLTQNEYPVREEWIHAIAKQGADGLRQVLIEDNEKEAARLKVPRHIALQWKRTATQDVPLELWEQCDEIRQRIDRLSDGIPSPSLGFTEKDGVTLDKDSCRAVIKMACSHEVTDQIKAEAETVLALAKQLRELEFQGINARELTAKYIELEEAPAPLDLYRDIIMRRHRPGCLAPVDLTPFIMLGKNNQSN